MQNVFRVIALAALLCFNIPTNADFSEIETNEESSDEISELVKELSNIQNDPSLTWNKGHHILNLLEKGDYEVSEYDYLWTLYALIVNTNPEGNADISDQDYIKIADVALGYLESKVGEWVYTDIGQFRIEVHTQAANAAAWTLRNTQPKAALAYIETALNENYELYLLDTKVRILLNLNENSQAYAIVKSVLKEYPNFGDFQDFLTNSDYIKWLELN